MKKIAQLVGCALLLSMSTAAQTYNFSHTTGTYTPLTSATLISDSSVWSNTTLWKVPIGFQFTFLDSTYDSLYVKGGGAVGFGLNPKKAFLAANFIKDREDSVSLSPVVYSLTGAPGERILKIEWVNAGYEEAPPANYINVQVWLYENDNCIEARYGPNSVSPGIYDNNLGEYIGIYTSDGSDIYALLYGSPASPSLTASESGYLGVYGTPSDGTIYAFCPPPGSTGTSDNAPGELSLYPNPVAGILYIDAGQAMKIESLSLFDMSGRCVLEVRNHLSFSAIDVTKLEAGVYLARILGKNGVITKKIIKQ